MTGRLVKEFVYTSLEPKFIEMRQNQQHHTIAWLWPRNARSVR